MPQFFIGLALIAVAAILGFYGTQLAREGWTKMLSPPVGEISSTVTRPYVIFASTQLVVPADGSTPIQVIFDLKNTGQSEAVGSFKDFTYYFSTSPEQREFAYQHSDPIAFSLAPSEQWRGHFLPSFVLSAEKLEALNAGTARLFVYAKYKSPLKRDEKNGNVAPGLSSRLYDPHWERDMQGRHSAVHITLDDPTRATLAGWLRRQKTPVGLAKRARAILLLAEGQTFTATARQVALRERHVRKWALRFITYGIDGLYDKARPGRKPVFSPGGGVVCGQTGVRTPRCRWAVAVAMG